MPIKRGTEDTTPTGPAFPFFQWNNGVTKYAVNVKGKWQEGERAIGLFLDRTANEEDWTALDTACAAAGFEQTFIKRTEGATPHWFARDLPLLVLTTKLPKLGSRFADRETLAKGGDIKRHGISFGWKVKREKDEATGEYKIIWQDSNPATESFLKPLVLVPSLIAQGYTTPLMITINGTMTGYMETALRRHYELQDTILKSAQAEAFIVSVQDTLVSDFGIEAPEEWQFPFYGSYLTLVDGGQEPFGTRAITQCNVMVCAEPETVDDTTLEAMCADANERSLCMEWEPRAIEWSLEDSKKNIALRENEIDEMATKKAQLRAVNAAASKAA